MYLQKITNKKIWNFFFFWHLEGHWRKKQDLDPDPDLIVRVTDPRIRIRIKMSRIGNTCT
jgi:hypothetical protein